MGASKSSTFMRHLVRERTLAAVRAPQPGSITVSNNNYLRCHGRVSILNLAYVWQVTGVIAMIRGKRRIVVARWP